MNLRLTRRGFLKDLPLAGAAAPLVVESVGRALAAEHPAPQLENDFFKVAFDAASGRLHVRRLDGAEFLSGAVARAHIGAELRSTGESAYRHTLSAVRTRDPLGEAQQLIVRSADDRRELDLELRVALYEQRAAVVIELGARNVSAQPLNVHQLDPVCALRREGGALHWAETTKILTNGAMYYDAGAVADFAVPSAEPVRSWWNVGLFRGYQREGLACGHLTNQTALGKVLAQREADGTVSIIAESVLTRGLMLAPGGEVTSTRFLLNLAPDPYTALEDYAGAMGKLLQGRVHSVLNGWCEWFFAYEQVSEEEVLRNAEFAARVLRPYGLEYIQLDEGFQRWHGEWEGNDRFPHGMKWLADRIRALGLRPGIWLAPYVISEPTDVFQQHPEWLLRHPDGRLKRVGPWPSEDSDWARGENPKRYGLDITHPGAAQWLAELCGTVANQWGYKLLKIDFVDWSLLSAHRYHDPGVTRAAAYRKGFEIMRRAVGPEGHLLDCGPGPVTVGLLDSMRIELDQNYGYPQQAWKQYFGHTASSASAAAKRYYFHRRAWINDADHVCLDLLPLAQAQAAATLIALTGGNTLSGDRLPDLDPMRLEILKKVFPSTGEAARPVDLFDSDRSEVFALKLRRPFGDWTVVGIFNRNEAEAVWRVLPLERLWLDPRRTFLAYDFWQERLHGEITGELRVQVGPASVVLLALHEKRGTPQVIGTNRHIAQGALELEAVAWDADFRILKGVSLGPLGTAHNVAIYVPEAQPWTQGGVFLHHDFPGYSLKMIDDHHLRLRARFTQASRVEWRISFDDFFRRRAPSSGT
jgi:alpha-galactosidase